MTIEDPAEKGFITDQDDLTSVEETDLKTTDGLAPEPDSAAVIAPTAAPTMAPRAPRS